MAKYERRTMYIDVPRYNLLSAYLRKKQSTVSEWLREVIEAQLLQYAREEVNEETKIGPGESKEASRSVLR